MRDSFPVAAQSISGLHHEQADPFDLGERLLTAREVAARLGVSERWLRDHATRRNPRIPAIKLGPLVRFRWADVQEFVAKLETEKNFKHR
ncbi:MAG: helix-turn-helix transcriptional regulator [Acidobacteriaceae bacterium]